MNYEELQTAIAEYLHRKDLTTQIPGFIELTESRINTGLKALENEGYATLQTADNPQDLPPDYNDMTAVQTPTDRGPRALERVPPAEMARIQRIAQNSGGGARWFTVQAKQITVWPFVIDTTSGLGPEIEIEYWTQLVALTVDIQTNDVLTRWPQLYLYGALFEGYSFTESPDKARNALGVFTSEIGEINRNAASAKWGAAPRIMAG